MPRMRVLLQGALIVLCLLVGAAPSLAAPVIVKTYYEENAEKNCSGSVNLCDLVFSIVPSGRQLTLTHLSCTLFGQSDRIVSASLGVKQGESIGREQFFVPVRLSGTTGVNRFAVSDDATLLLRAGRPMIRVVMDLPGTITMECQIIGKLVAK